ncbi:uncharacterized protein LOC135373580 [Ornithodoros turicata]|uniref:uncharacterized protein LOC135373580 n=1 Tax=Ornithodoros turicata TaxID=34597 RepID=UPI0031398796
MEEGSLSELERRLLRLSQEFGMTPYQDDPVRESAESSLESASDTEDGDTSVSTDEPTPDEQNRTLNDWCDCRICGQMPTVQERICCRRINEVLRKQPKGCITENEHFRTACLHTEVLSVALCEPQDPNTPDSNQQQAQERGYSFLVIPVQL